jgi:hypothetical protein
MATASRRLIEHPSRQQKRQQLKRLSDFGPSLPFVALQHHVCNLVMNGHIVDSAFRARMADAP